MNTYTYNKRRLRPMYILVIGMLIGMTITTIIAVNLLQTQAAAYEIKLEEKVAELAQKDLEIVKLKDEHEQELTQLSNTYEARITTLEADLAQQQEMYDTLLNNIETYEGGVSFSTLSKYWYIFKTAEPNCGLTPGMIQLADQLCREKDLNPDIIWSIIRLESRYQPSAQNSKTTARGLGQILAGTARSVYEDIMGNGKGTYTHEMAYNGYTNLEIMIAYVEYLRNNYGDLQTMIARYSGDSSGKYYNVIVGYMNEFGHSLTDTTYAGQRTK